jgi:hypothetical protein
MEKGLEVLGFIIISIILLEVFLPVFVKSFDDYLNKD